MVGFPIVLILVANQFFLMSFACTQPLLRNVISYLIELWGMGNTVVHYTIPCSAVETIGQNSLMAVAPSFGLHRILTCDLTVNYLLFSHLCFVNPLILKGKYNNSERESVQNMKLGP